MLTRRHADMARTVLTNADAFCAAHRALTASVDALAEGLPEAFEFRPGHTIRNRREWVRGLVRELTSGAPAARRRAETDLNHLIALAERETIPTAA